MRAEHVQAVLANRVDDLPEELREAYRFAEAVVTRNGEEDSRVSRYQTCAGIRSKLLEDGCSCVS
jgi:hypothetical protein